MKINVSMHQFHNALVKELFNSTISDEEVKCLMLLLHACKIRLSEAAKVSGGGTGFEGITTRHAAEAVAGIFSSGKKADYFYWYELWNGKWNCYAILENPPENLFPKLIQIRNILESHPWVDHLEGDDWDILKQCAEHT